MSDPVHRKETTKVTIIVAAYNRGTVLSKVLRTVIAQTETRWRALVIGDACTDDTEEQIKILNDERIRFINLPKRFGEQAGPNSVGMALADTPFVAFLNQDDYWLPNHLSIALEELQRSGADMYWARAAFFSNRGAWDDVAFFDEVSPKKRQLSDLYDHPGRLAEPVSAWVLTKDAVKKLGPMKLASETQLAPIVEFCQRACRMGLELEAGDAITVLKDHFWYTPPNYQNKATYADEWVRQIESGSIEGLLEQIEQELWLSYSIGMNRSFDRLPKLRGQSDLDVLDRVAGVNLSELRPMARNKSNGLLRQILETRTGKNLETQASLKEMIAFAANATQ